MEHIDTLSDDEFSTRWIAARYTDLPNSKALSSVMHRAKMRGNIIPSKLKSHEKIGYYIARFHEILDRSDLVARERGVEALKKVIVRKVVLTSEEIQRSGLFERMQEIEFIRTGRSERLSDVAKNDHIRTIQLGQSNSYMEWMNYLFGRDALYPDYLKYWALKSVSRMAAYNGDKHVFENRSKTTTDAYPKLQISALGRVFKAMEQKRFGEYIENFTHLPDEKFLLILHAEDFSQLYALALQRPIILSDRELEEIRGEWVRYPQGSPAEPLYDRLQEFHVPWCTANNHISTARKQLEKGDFYVYYSRDTDGKNAIPRIAIRMEGDDIAEIRGIMPDQNIDSAILPVLKDKLQEWGYPSYAKLYNASRINAIFQKSFRHYNMTNMTGEFLNPSYSNKELIFLFSQPETFGYGFDPRIDMIILHLSFLTKEHALLFIQNNGTHTLSNHIDKFSGLDKEIAMMLIDEGHTYSVAQYLDCFSGLDKEVAIRLIGAGWAKQVTHEIACFSDLALDSEYALLLIQNDHAEVLAQEIQNFQGLTKEIALLLIQNYQDNAVAHNLHCFSGIILDKDFAILLIKNGGQYTLHVNIEQFSGLDCELGLLCIKYGMVCTVMQYFHCFDGLTIDQNLAEFLIKQGYTRSLVKHLKHSKSLENDIAITLIQKGYTFDVANNIDVFPEWKPDKDIAINLIKNGAMTQVIEHSKRFSGLDREVLELIIERGGADLVIEYLEYFEGINLNKELAITLIQNGGAFGVSAHIDIFEGLDQSVAFLLIEKGYTLTVACHIKRFSGMILDEKMAMMLIRHGGGYGVADNLDMFEGLTLDKNFAMLLLREGGFFGIIRNLDKFHGLDGTVLSWLLRFGWSEDDALKNIHYFEGGEALYKNQLLK